MQHNKKKTLISGAGLLTLSTSLLLTACGGGGGGGSTPSNTIDLTPSDNTVQLGGRGEFPTISASSCDGYWVELNGAVVTDYFQCADGQITPIPSKYEQLEKQFKDGENTLKASVSGSTTPAITFYASIAPYDIVISSAGHLLDLGDTGAFTFATRKAIGWSSLAIDAKDTSYSLNAAKKASDDIMISLRPDGGSDTLGDYSLSAQYSDNETYTVELAANGRSLNTLNAFQLNNDAFNTLTPWIGELVSAYLVDGASLTEADSSYCMMVGSTDTLVYNGFNESDQTHPGCKLTVKNLDHGMTEGVAPKITVAFDGVGVNADEAHLNLAISFESAELEVEDVRSGDKVTANIVFASGIPDGQEEEKETSIELNLVVKQTLDQAFVLRYASVTPFEVYTYPEQQGSSIVSSTLSAVEEAVIELPQLFFGGGAEIEKALVKALNDGVTVPLSNIFEFQEGALDPVVANNIRETQSITNDRVVAVGNAGNHGALLSFGGNVLLERIDANVGQAALGFPLSKDLPSFISGGIPSTGGVSLGVSQNMVNQLLFATFQKGVSVDPLSIDFENILGNPKVEMEFDFTFDSLPTIELSQADDGAWLKIPNIKITGTNRLDETFTAILVTDTLTAGQQLFEIYIDIKALLKIKGSNNQLTFEVDESNFEFSIVTGSTRITTNQLQNLRSLAGGDAELISIIETALKEVVPANVPQIINDFADDQLGGLVGQHETINIECMIKDSSPELQAAVRDTVTPAKVYQLDFSNDGIVVDNTAVAINGDLEEVVSGPADGLFSLTIMSDDSPSAIAQCESSNPEPM